VSKLKRAAFSVLLMFAVAAGLVAIDASPAFANWGGCPSGAVCTYWDSSGNGSVYYYTYPGHHNCINIGEPWNDDISSVWNNTGVYPVSGHVVRFYRDVNCTNSFYSYAWYQGDKDTVCSLYCFPDAYSSLRWGTDREG